MTSFDICLVARRCVAAVAVAAGSVVQAAPWQAVDLGLVTGRANVFVRDVNSAGQVTGFAFAASGQTATAFFGDQHGLLDIGALGAAQNGYAASEGLRLNERGQVVGNASLSSSTRAWRYGGGQLQDLGTLGGVASEANVINASGQVAGRSFTANGGAYSAFVGDGQTLTNLGNLGGSYLEVAAFNDRGYVVGTANKGTALSRAYMSAGSQIFEQQTANSTQTHSFATDVNDWNQVVGSLQPVSTFARHAAMADGEFQPFVDIHTWVSLGGDESQANANNDAGDIVGWARVGAGQQSPHAFLLPGSGGQVRDLGTLGGSWSMATDVNALGQVVGESALADGTNSWFVYRDGQMLDLVDQLSGLYGPLGDPTVVFASLSDAGHVAGTVITGDGTYRSFLLSPVPEPQVAALLLVGLATLCCHPAGRRRMAVSRLLGGGLLVGGALLATAAQAAETPPPRKCRPSFGRWASAARRSWPSCLPSCPLHARAVEEALPSCKCMKTRQSGAFKILGAGPTRHRAMSAMTHQTPLATRTADTASNLRFLPGVSTP